MKYIEVATLRENILHLVRAGASIGDIEDALEAYSDVVFENGFVRANEEFIKQALEKNSESKDQLPDQPTTDPDIAEPVQLTCAALTRLIGAHYDAEQFAKLAVHYAKEVLYQLKKNNSKNIR